MAYSSMGAEGAGEGAGEGPGPGLAQPETPAEAKIKQMSVTAIEMVFNPDTFRQYCSSNILLESISKY